MNSKPYFWTKLMWLIFRIQRWFWVLGQYQYRYQMPLLKPLKVLDKLIGEPLYYHIFRRLEDRNDERRKTN